MVMFQGLTKLSPPLDEVGCGLGGRGAAEHHGKGSFGAAECGGEGSRCGRGGAIGCGDKKPLAAVVAHVIALERGR